ncbi:hypothetical protein [Bacillus sp. FJAT-50079]|uniref:hypothetical protein n=1 Tax=Bacillus sp. FJAT-50079 TaxID=2833577 RepID=UPI001BC92290|nr:hypothetical protein [Bacillus sp. FJAT-50079]MBS4207855.1 hypothetical protein [Bacillus sp. FJAT-50079]MBS4210841.1 hypothetical protein [Bacillus sp. FJAT-50079]
MHNSELARLDTIFEGFFDWLAKQYDRTSGGFYYAQSSIDDQRFTPDIESTAQAINILLRNELITLMPAEMRAKMVHFFQNKQDPESGYFYDENPAMKQDEVMVSRALNYSTGSLRRLGSNPLYSLPVLANQAPDFIKSPEAYAEKWKSISLVNSWRGCDLLASSCIYIGQMPLDKQKPFVDHAVQYLESIQDPETGLWGEGSLYVQISGTFKLHTFYRKHQIPMPRIDKIYQTVLHCLRTENAKDMCYIRNPIDLLSYMNVAIPEHELTEIIRITIDNITKLKRPDGGFSREIDHSPVAPNVAQVKADEYYPNMPIPVPLSNGLYEGDMNASTQATLIRLQLHKLLGIHAEPLKEAKRFYSALASI